ncbi:MAG: hypothetical protein ACFFCW_45335 [Candidatus Hodarchaeota archaeon]
MKNITLLEHGIMTKSTYFQQRPSLRPSLLDDSSRPVWYHDFPGPVAQGGSVSFKPDATKKGRYVKVKILGKNKEGNGYLSLAEVQVFGEFTK